MNSNKTSKSKINILSTGAGAGGGNNIINSLRKSSLNLKIIGSNCDKYILAKSIADKNYLLPEVGTKDYQGYANEELLNEYIEAVNYIIKKEKISLIMTNSEREVRAVSEIGEKINCRFFLPDKETIKICQDKYEMYKILKKNDIPVAESYELKNYDDVDKAFKILPKSDRYWVRMKEGAGSKGATWVKTPQQAKNWIELWDNLRGFPVNTFTISEFLPGKDYAFQSVWKDGKPVVMKMCQRLSYFFGVMRLSGMSSTPLIAKTVNDQKALKTIIKAINAITPKPQGIFSIDLKGDKNDEMCITEINIGRFCMITPIFDLTGKINTVEAFVKCALDFPIDNNYDLDYDKDKYLIRQLDTLPTICSINDINNYNKVIIRNNKR